MNFHNINFPLIKKIVAGALITGVLAGCSKSMLKEDLYSQPGSPNVTGPAGATLLTNGIYSYVQFLSYFGGNNWLLDNEANTDEFYCAWGDLDPTSWGGQQNFLNEDPGHFQVQLKWDNLYFMIAQANQVINQFSDLTDASTIQNVAQARFWRAYAYEKLYYVYGPVPLVTGKENQTGGIAKASAADVESFIQSELTAVENILPASYSASDYGRPTKWAVKAFLARFYLNTKNWQKASDYAHDVIANGGFSLQADYQSIFGQNGNSEVILAVNHIAVANRGNKYIALSMDAPIETAFGIKGVSASSGYGMATQFYYSFAAGDKRVAPYDPTTAMGIAIAGIKYNPDGSPVYGTAAAPKRVEDALNRVITCKWPVIMNIPNGEDAPLNVPLLRLGETWLTYAEAQNELGNLGEAINAVNNLRPRTGLAPITASSQAAMRDSILNERGWELYHEGYRREDLMRAGKQKFLDKVNAKYQFYFKTPMPWASDTNRAIQPIPTSALQLNPLLKQNAGY